MKRGPDLMSEPMNKTGNATTSPEEKTTHAKGSIEQYAASGIKGVPVIAKDVYDHLPAFYQSALTVMERNHRCIIEAVE